MAATASQTLHLAYMMDHSESAIALQKFTLSNFHKNRPHVRANGFSLVEMAVVMVLVGIMLSISLSGGLLIVNASAIRGTKDKQLLIRDALVSYLRTDGRLPCPDVGPKTVTSGAIAAGVALDGRENRAATIGTGTDPEPDTTADCASSFGAIPYVDLGLNRDAALDAWGNFMMYRISNDPVTFSDWVRKANFSPANRGSMRMSDRLSAPATIPPVVVSIISHGKNGLGAWTTRNTQLDPTGAGEDELVNAAGCIALTCYGRDMTESTAATGGPFDDIALGITLSDLMSPLIKDGSMKASSATLNETFESIIDLVALSATRTYTAPVAPIAGFCSYTLTGDQILNDPWGQSIKCATGSAAYLIGVNPTEIVCTMKSTGPDKASDGGDDTVRAVTKRELDTRLLRLGC